MSEIMMTVSALNTKIKSLLEATFMHSMVEGEVSSVTYHTSGHLYFSIKDDKSAIKCVMWRSSVAKMKFRIEKGMHIILEGSVSVYTPRGEYQFQTVRIEPYGKGTLALAYEQLKQKLKEKGYFSPEYKKAIPKNIRKLVLVTAKESAALYDMLKIIEKRWPLIEVIIVDTLVQGEDSASQIARSLQYADRLRADCVVVGRGGGSAEDLWSFNEEIVADTIFEMHTPVVSAVGHEVDIMISDLVADLRAPTPSAAMEMILPDKNEIYYLISDYEDRYKKVIDQNLQSFMRELSYNEELLRRSSPIFKLSEMRRKFLLLEAEYGRIMHYKLERFQVLMPEMMDQYHKTITFFFEKKVHQIEYLNKNILMNDPKDQCRTGWAKVSKSGKSTSLTSLKINEKFVLEDEFNKVEALCISKHEI
jgi:exodeoxyribonuclease VII large subunit